MKDNKAPVFTMTIVAIILGGVLWKQFDFKTFRFEHTGLGILYLIVFAFAIFVLVKNRRNKHTGSTKTDAEVNEDTKN